MNHLLDHEIDLSAFDARFKNDDTGASAFPPAMLLKIGGSEGLATLFREATRFATFSYGNPTRIWQFFGPPKTACF